jgi:pimeloyl-ACP methyl ester carboxylesterase
MTDLLPGVSQHTVRTDRLELHVLTSGPEDGVPVVLLHGNLSTSRFWEHLLPNAPEHLRFVVPDMRGFGRSERAPLDATRGLRDWADDTRALVRQLGIEQPVHLAGWSTGGAAVARYAIDHPTEVASLHLVDPVSPYGYGGVRRDGTPCAPDHAGSGAGSANPELVQRLRDGDAGSASPFSVRNVLNGFYWHPDHWESREREDLLVEEVLLTWVDDRGYPGDATASEHWPGFAPGPTGLLNALSPRYCDWSGLVDLEPAPPVLWTRGSADLVVADDCPLELGQLGRLGVVPGWPGEGAYPPQQMVTQTADVLGAYAAAGGHVETEVFEGSGHAPFVDAAGAWAARYWAFLDGVARR